MLLLEKINMYHIINYEADYNKYFINFCFLHVNYYYTILLEINNKMIYQLNKN
jgi:hypothetical protein